MANPSHEGLISWEPSVFLAPLPSNNNKVTLRYREVFSEELSPCTRVQRAGVKVPPRWNMKILPADLLFITRSNPSPIPSASLVKGDGLTGEQFFALCFLPACAAHPNSGRSNKGATQTARTPLASRRRRHDKAVVNKPRSEPPSHKSDKRPMMRRV